MNFDTVNIVGPMKADLKNADEKLPTYFVDGGMKHFEPRFKRAFSIGDNDSFEGKMEEVLPQNKDRGDLFFAVQKAQDSGAKQAFLYGFVGGRMDHQILLLGDLLELAGKRTRFDIFEEEELRMSVLPSGNHCFDFTGPFSVFSAREQKLLYQGSCQYPNHKEYPQLIGAFTTHGLSNYSDASFSITSQAPFCLMYGADYGPAY